MKRPIQIAFAVFGLALIAVGAMNTGFRELAIAGAILMGAALLAESTNRPA